MLRASEWNIPPNQIVVDARNRHVCAQFLFGSTPKKFNASCTTKQKITLRLLTCNRALSLEILGAKRTHDTRKVPASQGVLTKNNDAPQSPLLLTLVTLQLHFYALMIKTQYLTKSSSTKIPGYSIISIIGQGGK